MSLWLLLGYAAAAAPLAAPRFVLDEASRIEVRWQMPQHVQRHLGDDPGKEEAQRFLSLHLIDAPGGAQQSELGPPIFARYRVAGDTLILSPRYGLTAGKHYRAVARHGEGQTASADSRVPAPPRSEPTAVKKVYPSSNRLPSNHLKFYIYFSGPMREGREVFDHLQIFDEQRRPIADPWRRTELWDDHARRLTLWIHPGRVKTGVNLREEEGPVLEPGRNYTLRIASSMRDAKGQPLGRAHTKVFRTTKPDRRRPLPQRWKITAPQAATQQSVILELGEPLDHALLGRLLRVQDEAGQKVRGRVKLDRNESRWSFRPRGPWQAGTYRIEVSPLLEDLAGNTPGRAFDTDLAKPPGEKPQLELTFRPGE